MDRKKPNELYAYCTEESEEGIFKSINNGVSWKIIFPVKDIATLTINPMDSSIYIIGQQHTYRSIDGGQIWDTMKNAFPNDIMINTLAIDPVHSSTLYIGTNYGIFKSIDRGREWLKINKGLPENIFVRTMVVNQQNSDIIYIGTNYDGIFISINGGVSWQQINNGLPCSPGIG